MTPFNSFAKGLGVGAAVTYFFDPIAGGRRRSLVRDQFISAMHDVQDFVDRGVRDLNNRLSGCMAEARGRLVAEDVSDEQIAERVRSTMGRYVSHSRAIDVAVNNGQVTVSGTILADEVPSLLCAIKHVRGVTDVSNQLDVHQEPDVSSLQGGGQQCRQMSRTNWSPGTRLVAATAGLGLIVNGAFRQQPMGAALGMLGVGLFWQAISNQSVGRASSRAHGWEMKKELGPATPQQDMSGSRQFRPSSNEQATSPM